MLTSAALNVIITVSAVYKFGLIGVAAGTLIAMLYHTCYFVWYLRKNIICRSELFFVKYMITDTLIGVISFAVSSILTSKCNTYFEWTIFACKTSAIVMLVSIIINTVFYRQQFKSTIILLRRQKS